MSKTNASQITQHSQMGDTHIHVIGRPYRVRFGPGTMTRTKVKPGTIATGFWKMLLQAKQVRRTFLTSLRFCWVQAPSTWLYIYINVHPCLKGFNSLHLLTQHLLSTVWTASSGEVCRAASWQPSCTCGWTFINAISGLPPWSWAAGNIFASWKLAGLVSCKHCIWKTVLVYGWLKQCPCHPMQD